MSLSKLASIGTLVASIAVFLSPPSRAGFDANAIAPEPADQNTIDAQLKRFAGQTSFLNPTNRYNSRLPSAPARMGDAKAAPGGASRVQQESDVFKVGKPGSKLLFLLNDYRGLQAVSFADGIDKAKLLGRAEATGNWSDTMYYDAAHDRILVLERYWFDNSRSYAYSRVQSRALVYDVKDPSKPRITSELPLDGEIADSRLVGDVLYVATSVRPDWRNNESKGKGYVYSLRLAAEGPRQIERAELALPSSSRENMSIAEVNEGGTYKYYLLAVLSQSGWGWWDRQSLVEVVDVSDPHGAIKPVMVVSAKGMIAKRSQTTIKNNTLIVTSNYWPQPEGALKPMRVSVETFKLPTESLEILTEDEAQYRKLGIDRALDGKSEAARGALYEKLVSDSTLGIRGRFVRTPEGKLRKIVPDSVVTVGDASGLSVSLRDVRYDGDLLEVFWVPSNNVDPFDVFDISHPEQGVKHVKRLQFDGWVERAEPIAYHGKRYVLGLGWAVPVVDNESSRRYPQAMLFEIRGQGKATKLETVAQLTLGSGNVWANFGGPDKYVEIRTTADGKGQVLFGVDSWDQDKVASGGKLIGFDLNKAEKGDDDALKEGAFLVGNPDWLKRVFTNPEIDRVNTFSNTALGTFDVKDIGGASTLARAAQVLELARDVQGYLTIGSGERPRGVQIVSTGRWWDENTKPQTILRVVPASEPDAELSSVLGTRTLAGQYVGSVVDRRDQSLWVATRLSRRTGAAAAPTFVVKYSVYRLTADPANPETLGSLESVSWTERQPQGETRWYWYGEAPFQLLQLKSGAIVAKVNTDLYTLSESGNEIAASALEAKGCVFGRQSDIELQYVDDSLYLASKVLVEDPERAEVAYTRNFVAPVKIEGGSAVCLKAANIPGKLIATLENGQWITEDERVLDIVRYDNGKSYQVLTSTAIDSVSVAGDIATLADDYRLNSSQAGAIKRVGPAKLAFMDTQATGYRPLPGRWCRWRDCGYATQGFERLVLLGFDKSRRFTDETYALPSLDRFSGQLVDVYPEADGSWLGILSDGHQLKALSWSPREQRPSVLRLIAVGPGSSKSGPAESVTLHGWYYSGTGLGSGLHYTPRLRSIEAARGLFGVQQFLLE